MPITQERLITLLDEVQEYQNLIEQAYNELTYFKDKFDGLDKRLFESAIANLTPKTAYHTLVRCTIEREHYRRVARKNSKRRERLERERRAAGVTERTDAKAEFLLPLTNTPSPYPNYNPNTKVTEPHDLSFQTTRMTYQEAKASESLTARQLWLMFPDEAPEPVDGQTLDESLWKLPEAKPPAQGKE
jgi:hypothetical protein